MAFPEWPSFYNHILLLEADGLVTRTFRRLDPERQQAVLDAILEEAVEKGPTALNIKAVAQRADVSVGSLYQYFPDRSRLLEFAVQLCVRYMTDMFDQIQPLLGAMPLKEALSAYLMGGLEWSSTQASMVRFFGRAAYMGDPFFADSLVKPVADKMFETTRYMLLQAANRGEIRSDVDLEAVAQVVNAMIVAVGDGQMLPFLKDYFHLDDQEVPFERVMAAMLTMIENGLG